MKPKPKRVKRKCESCNGSGHVVGPCCSIRHNDNLRKCRKEIFVKPDEVCIKCGRVWKWDWDHDPAGGPSSWSLKPQNYMTTDAMLKRLRKEAAAERRKAGIE